jgi:hypothetical protein
LLPSIQRSNTKRISSKRSLGPKTTKRRIKKKTKKKLKRATIKKTVKNPR